MRKDSPYGKMKTWKLIRIIVKSGDDLRQEQFAMQLISQFHQTFRAHNLRLWLLAYEIICTGADCGLVECCANAISLDSLKKKTWPIGIKNLNEFFQLYYSTPRG